MNLADRYSCQEHGQDKHEDCIACEVYGDIAELVDRISELEIHSELYATRYTEGVKAGMERAAVIASNVKAPFSRFTIAAKIRNEIEND